MKRGSQGRILLLLLIVAGDREPSSSSTSRLCSPSPTSRRGRPSSPPSSTARPGRRRRRLLPPLRRRHRPLAARRGDPDAGRGRDLRAVGKGPLIVSFASTIGASLAFLSSRYLLRDWVKARFGERVEAIDRGHRQRRRLLPAHPAADPGLPLLPGQSRHGADRDAARHLRPGQPGRDAARHDRLRERGHPARGDREHCATSSRPPCSARSSCSACSRSLAKALVGWWKRRRVYRGWRRPRRFDRNLIVIGAGAGGLVTALIGATVRAKVTLIEQGEMGGDCLNTGCVPSKALIRSARAAHEIRTAAAYGLAPGRAARSASAR